MVKETANPKKKLSTLEALRARVANLDLGGGGQGFWSPKEGKQTIRILSPVGEMEFFFTPVGRHYFPGKKYTFCPDFTSDGQLPCPVCEITKELYRGGKAEKMLAEQMGRRKAFWMNVVVRSKDGDTGPWIFTPGVTIFNAIIGLINDPDYGDITDPIEGYDITIQRVGTGKLTEYGVIPRPKVTPLSADSDQADEWIEKAKDLSWIELTDDPDEDKDITGDHVVWVLPYDRIMSDFGLDDVESMDASDYDEGAVDRPVQKPAPKAKAKRPVVDEDTDDDSEESKPEEDDEDEVRKTIQRRRARKSVRH